MEPVRRVAPLDAAVCDVPSIPAFINGIGMTGHGGDEFAMAERTVVPPLPSAGACCFRIAGVVVPLELALPELP
jgi:hypothetical protein